MNRLATKLLCGLAVLLLAPGLVFAQDGTITGTVTDGETEEPLPGSTVQISEIGAGVATNMEGEYELNVPAGTYTVRVSFVGYIPEEREVEVVAGETVTADFTLTSDLDILGEVVVTALGVERQERSLGYSASTVRSEDLIQGNQEDIVSALSGRIPGVDVTQQSGNVGGSTRITLRGVASLTGDNQPLFVIDGVPISNSNIAFDGTRITGSFDTGNRAGDINPQDIEEVTVLKGGAAAALYGQRAKDGAIIITTKRGFEGASSVEFSSSLTASRPARLPDFQNDFAQGSIGKYNITSLNGWGPRIAGQEVEDFRGETVSLQAQPDNVSDFWDTGTMSNTSVSFTSGTATTDYRLGLTYMTQTGIAPESGLDRVNLTANMGTRLENGFRSRLNAQYIKTDTKGRVAAGGNDPNTLVSIINGLPRTIAQSDLLPYIDPETLEQRNLGTQTNNPYWIANENPFTNDVERFIGSGEIGFEPFPFLDITYRVGTDIYTENRRRINRVGTIGREDGNFTDEVLQERQIDSNLLVTFDYDLTPDLTLTAIAGNNINQETFQRVRNNATELSVDELYNFGNANSNSPSNIFQQRRIIGVFGDVTLGYQNWAFLTVTGRNDWSSTLPTENNSFFYPSVNTSVVLTDALDFGGRYLSYLKLRANYAQVGSDESPYQLDFRFFPVNNIFGQFGTGNSFPFGGRTGFTATNTIPPTDLKPQNQISWEIGSEARFFDGRMVLDATYYSQRTEDQIISIPRPQSTGFGQRRTNIGTISNKGVEIDLSGTAIAARDFSWRVSTSFATNINEVVELAEGVDQVTVQSGFNSFQIRAEEGKSLGIYGVGWERDPETGRPVVDPETGLRRSGEDTRIGDLYPDFRVGFGNTFNYRGFSLGFNIDWKNGGSIFSNTVGALRRAGLAEETAINRDGTFIDTEAVVERDGQFVDNDVPVTSMQAFWGAYADASIIEGNVFDASYVKLRSARIGYTFPQEFIAGTPIQNANIALSGNNLLLLYSNIPHIDPETNIFGSGAIGEGYEFGTVPQTRSISLSVNLTF
ncbi:MAG: SusC/RagA family TonB-linked outer membrane protein [Longimonas sp.]|uniref:SusC/RagA family TonB-linked outer membrane protein n=1 Tax=Longimonas sp. TaxID=2039626 RepID=UPI00335CC7BC